MTARQVCIYGTSTTLQGLTAEETFWWFGSITRSSLESISLRSLGTIFSAIPHAHAAPLSTSGGALTEALCVYCFQANLWSTGLITNCV